MAQIPATTWVKQEEPFQAFLDCQQILHSGKLTNMSGGERFQNTWKMCVNIEQAYTIIPVQTGVHLASGKEVYPYPNFYSLFTNNTDN